MGCNSSHVAQQTSQAEATPQTSPATKAQADSIIKDVDAWIAMQSAASLTRSNSQGVTKQRRSSRAVESRRVSHRRPSAAPAAVLASTPGPWPSTEAASFSGNSNAKPSAINDCGMSQGSQDSPQKSALEMKLHSDLMQRDKKAEREARYSQAARRSLRGSRASAGRPSVELEDAPENISPRVWATFNED